MPVAKSRSALPRLLVLVLLAAAVYAGVAAFRVGPEPTIAIETDRPGIGRRTAVTVVVEEHARGLAGVTVDLVQGERVERLAESSHTPISPWRLWGGERTPSDTLAFDVGSETLKGLKEGEATLRVTASRAGGWLRHPGPTVRERTLPVRFRPPALAVLSSQTYVDQGGCEAVVYRVGEGATRDGVRAGDWWFPGSPLPGGGPQDRFALFGIPFDMGEVSRVRLVVSDEIGNEAQAAFIDRFRPRPFRNDTIQLSDAFMERVVPAILSQTPELEDQGDLLKNYLTINGELRRKNAQELIDLTSKSAQEFLWREPFLQMRNAAVMSDFADRRTYVYQGRAVDRQDHLGYDLASVKQTEIQAANDGTVALARYFGIYGNAVIIDHGYGLFSLYGHLSSISVSEGARVARGEVVGRSGETGLAGGDHLHYSVLLHGLSVNPSEWWDGHWIHDRLKLKLGAAMPFR